MVSCLFFYTFSLLKLFTKNKTFVFFYMVYYEPPGWGPLMIAPSPLLQKARPWLPEKSQSAGKSLKGHKTGQTIISLCSSVTFRVATMHCRNSTAYPHCYKQQLTLLLRKAWALTRSLGVNLGRLGLRILIVWATQDSVSITRNLLRGQFFPTPHG